MSRSPVLAGLIGLVVLVAACSESVEPVPPSTTATTTPAAVTTVTPTTRAPTTTADATTTTASVATTTPTTEHWDLLWISDRWAGQPQGLGVTARKWAERIEQTRDIEVAWKGWVEGGLDAVSVLEELDDEGSELAALVAEAEVIAFFGDPGASGIREEYTTCIFDFLAGAPGIGDPFAAYAGDELAPYGDVIASIYERILELRAGQPTALRVYDLYVSLAPGWEAAGLDTECWSFFELFSQTIKEAAAALGIPTVSMLDAFNGLDRSEDPLAKGYIGAGNFHLSADGQSALLDLLDELGYKPLDT